MDPLTGLRAWTRDPELPALAGDAELVPPEEPELRALVQEHLLLPEAAPIAGLAWDYARWKPGVSITCAYRVRLSDGTEELAVLKRYRGDKAAILAERPLAAERPPGLAPLVHARAVLPERGLVLWTPPADRALGLRDLLDEKRFARLLRRTGLFDPGSIRRRKTRFELLRYKPERRAVHRVHLRVREDKSARPSLAVRALPADEAARVIEARTRFEAVGGAELSVRLACGHARYGLLVEPWLDDLAGLGSDFGAHAGRAATLLARLHALPLSDGVPPADAREPLTRHAALFGDDPAVARALERLQWPAPNMAPTWIHGDFHADQVAGHAGRDLLLDLDCLGAGAPGRDLADWMADRLYESGGEWSSTALPFLDAYRAAGGRALDPNGLRRLVACELAMRGASSLRRLEAGAPERARAALERAVALAEGA